MEKINNRSKSFWDALKRLKKSLDDFKEASNWDEQTREGFSQITNVYYQDHLVSLRDSLVKRFEFTFELFWKFLKLYLEKVSLLQLEYTSLKHIIRSSCNIKLITEDGDAEKFIDMINSRNLTSHIYKEEVAEKVSIEIPKHYELLKKYADKLTV